VTCGSTRIRVWGWRGNCAERAWKEAVGVRPIRVAVVGCGAVTRQFHLPVLAGHEEVRVVALVDRDLRRATRLGSEYGVERILGDGGELDPASVDAAVVATPPSHHAPCAIELLRRGIHVLVEKPMALTWEEAAAMVEVAETGGLILAAGHFRRLFPSTRLLRAVVESGMLGSPLGFDVEEGGVHRWPSATLDNLRPASAGGGALIDFGSHTLDRLLFTFSGEGRVLSYEDNALGGVESDCLLHLRIVRDGKPVDGRVELSRTRRLRNTLRIECERGTLEVPADGRYAARIKCHDVELVDAVLDRIRSYQLNVEWQDEATTPWYEVFRAEIDDWLGAMRSGRQPVLSGRSVLATVKLVEECYRRARPLYEPGVDEGLRKGGAPRDPSDVEVEARNETGSITMAGPVGGDDRRLRRVLVTGATGFLGCRVAEILRVREGWHVRALVRDPATAGRLARLSVEMYAGDLRSKEDLNRAVEGCDAVVHCAVGTSWGYRNRIFAVTVSGTRNLAEAALAAGVDRFVHLSSIAIHGDVAGVLDESTPIRPLKGDDYGESKARAEQEIRRFVRGGLPAVILRPACVYGPFSTYFTVHPIRCLAAGKLVIGTAGIPSNTVYVDNVVEAIVRALNAPEGSVRGEAFTIGEGDELSWEAFYGYFADAMGVELPIASSERSAGPVARGHARGPIRWVRSWYRALAEVAMSAEVRALARRVLETDPLGRLPREILERYPALRRKLSGPTLYRKHRPVPADVLEVRSIPAVVSIEKARRVLGYEPRVPRDLAMTLTLDWLRYARLIG